MCRDESDKIIPAEYRKEWSKEAADCDEGIEKDVMRSVGVGAMILFAILCASLYLAPNNGHRGANKAPIGLKKTVVGSAVYQVVAYKSKSSAELFMNSAAFEGVELHMNKNSNNMYIVTATVVGEASGFKAYLKKEFKIRSIIALVK